MKNFIAKARPVIKPIALSALLTGIFYLCLALTLPGTSSHKEKLLKHLRNHGTGGSCTIDAGTNQTHCSGGPWYGTLGGNPTASGATCNSNNWTYYWTPSAPLNFNTIANPSATVTTTTTFFLTVTNTSCGCDERDNVTITINCMCCKIENPELQQEIQSKKIKLFPNPSNGVINIQSMDDQVAGSVLGIFDLKGALLMERQGLFSESRNETLDLSGYPKGAYYLQILNKGTVEHFERILLSN